VPLLFCSGACALLYQTVWMREFRLVFGASTLASAAVTAIFMGGLGVGATLIGKRLASVKNPLALYSSLEFLIALSAAASPALIWIVRKLYYAVGGSLVLGSGLATGVRLLLSALVLLVPTTAMGATLPAIVSAVRRGRSNDRTAGLLYGVNTLGAVFGAALGTFVLIEVYGVRNTLWLAILINLLLALVARMLSRRCEVELLPERATPPNTVEDESRISPRLVIVAAGVVGFAFFLAELVWYRMLGPLLGGSTFTFGLILVVALAGIGLGGVLYALRLREPGPDGLAVTCLLEALFIAIPFALGDRLALLASLLRPLGTFGLLGLAGGWMVVAGIVILPAAIVAGYQFPLLIGLVRRSTDGIGKAVALAYTANTLGSILGALFGGFGLVGLLRAPVVWQMVVLVLLALGLAIRLGTRPRHPAALVAWSAVAASVLALVLVPLGPTAVWRHSAIGAGRGELSGLGENGLEYWMTAIRRSLYWERDGLESSVALRSSADMNFVVNGKTDGSALNDSPTQVMSGLIGAALHPEPRKALVIGLGTGSTAGWLAQVPSIERVDVIEIEPVMKHVAEVLGPVNRDVLHNPKVHVMYGDARELLVASKERYDIIFSEPSNPYRAGIASLFSREYYQAARRNLTPDGIFLQWLQGYEVFPSTVRTAMATLASEFRDVEAWQTGRLDFIFAGSASQRTYDVGRLRERLATEPFHSAMLQTWRTDGVEGFLAAFIASDGLARAIAAEEGDALNTDDLPLLEYGFARSVGKHNLLQMQRVRAVARRLGVGRPAVRGGSVDWERLEQIRAESVANRMDSVPSPADFPDVDRDLLAAITAWVTRDTKGLVEAWTRWAHPPRGLLQTRIAAEVAVATSARDEQQAIEAMRAYAPVAADLLSVGALVRDRDFAAASRRLQSIYRGASADPWAARDFFNLAGPLVVQIAHGSPAETPALVEAFSRPWVLNLGDDVRLRTLVRLAGRDSSSCRQALAAYEVSPEWSRQVLLARARCYAQVAPELVAFAQADLARYESQEEQEFSVSRRSRDAEPDNGGEGHPTPAHDAEAAAAPATVPTQHSAPFEVGPASR
jgi:spermidine synthase/predicted MFS family arabinose efflux permease